MWKRERSFWYQGWGGSAAVIWIGGRDGEGFGSGMAIVTDMVGSGQIAIFLEDERTDFSVG